jgi:iron complex outermembrane receptor protein
MRFLKFLASVLLFTVGGMLAFGAAPATVRGTVSDSAGGSIAGAQVTLTSLTTQKVLSTFTGQDGSYTFTAVNAGTYKLTVARVGFQDFLQSISLRDGQWLNVDPTLQIGTASQTVTVHGGGLLGATTQPSKEDVFQSSQTVRVMDQKQMNVAGPVAGAAQIIALAPGANVTGYGNTGATKYTVTLNGINQGWGGYGGFTGGGALAITFDGVPIVDPATDLWQSPTIPEIGMIQNTNVTYGPGTAASRWYNNVGGAIEFTPVQPAAKRYATGSLTYGSYAQKDAQVNLGTGLYKGWSTVFSGGAGKGNDFRHSSDGFQNPSKDWAALAKTVKSFQQNSLEIAGYYAYGGGYRSQVIPTVPNPEITVNGQPGSQEYSQPTTGFFSNLPFASYNKYDTNQMGLIYARENVELDKTTNVQNLSWYMHIARSHDRYNDAYVTGPQLAEHNSPYTNTIGDRFLLTKSLPHNMFSAGGYYLHALYNSRNNFYNPADGGAKRTVNIGGKIRSSYFDQDNFAIFAQDDIDLFKIVHITPGLRYVGFTTNYSNHSLQDFSFVPGVVLSTRCPADPNFVGIKGNTKDQGAACGGNANRSGMEPSVDASVLARPWLSVYGSFQEALRAPSLGGGGGLFQAVDPASYHLERGTYYQVGFKVLPPTAKYSNNLLAGAAYYHQNYANQEIDTTNAAGNTISANGTSSYQGVNMYLDDDPIHDMHLFANGNVEGAHYTNYIVGGLNLAGENTCTQPATPTKPASIIPGCAIYDGLPVSYVPVSTANFGVYYDIHPRENLTVEPMVSYQFIGSQHIFNNAEGAPSTQAMSSYGTLNLGVKAPYKHVALNVNALNVTNNRYNQYEYVSSGGYFNTTTSGYVLAYPGSPVVVYGGVSAQF